MLPSGSGEGGHREEEAQRMFPHERYQHPGTESCRDAEMWAQRAGKDWATGTETETALLAACHPAFVEIAFTRVDVGMSDAARKKSQGWRAQSGLRV